MTDMIKDIADFHRATGAPILRKPRMPDPKRVRLRYDLIHEEVVRELLPAIGQGDMVKIADGIADSIVVHIGTALEFGIPLDVIWKLVHAANMSKVLYAHKPDCTIAESGSETETFCSCGAVRYRHDGKIMKPDGFISPDVAIRNILDIASR